MSQVPYIAILKVLAPEVVLVVTALVALTADLVFMRERLPASSRRLVGVVALIGLFASLIPLLSQMQGGPVVDFGPTLVVNKLSAVFSAVIVALTILTVIISMDFDLGRHVGEYFATLLFGAVGMMLLVSTEELLTIFVALELTSICLYILTAFHKGALRSQEAAVKYFMFGAISSAFLLFGLSYIYGVTGTTNLKVLAGFTGGGQLMGVGLLFLIVGFGFKVAVVPFHLWAPDAYEGAPTPVTAFIATGSKVASFFIFTRLMIVGFNSLQGSAFWGRPGSGWTLLLAATAVASMVLGNVVAIVQHNVKRLLAYSSIAHAGYIFIGMIAATTTGATSVLFYVIVYGLTNLGAFGVVAALSSRAGGDDLENLNGMARRAPLLSFFLLVFLLSLAGIPPLGGFFGKFYLFAAAVQRDAQSFGLLWLVILGILMSAVSLYYYLIVLKHVYVTASRDSSRIFTPAYVNVSLGIVALAVLALGVFPEPILSLLNRLVTQL